MNESVPKGRPVIVCVLISFNSPLLSSASMNCFHVWADIPVNEFKATRGILPSACPTCAAALDHFYSHGCSTMCARTGFLST